MMYLHANKIIHRDLKPQNILLDEFLHPKISDFGLSKITNFMSGSMNFQSMKGMKGTPIYMAPEIFNNENYSQATDVYAFSIVLYEIFNFEPFQKFSLIKIIHSVCNGYRPSISNDIPYIFQNIIDRCWAQDPEIRPSFAEIVDQMRTEESFISDLIDESEFFDYVDYIDKCGNSFNIKKRFTNES